MHEANQVQKLIVEAQAMLQKKGRARAAKVSILMGDLLGFDEGCVRLYWEEMTIGTALEGVPLVIRNVPARLKCPACSQVFDKKGSRMECPDCQVLGTPTDQGKEFKLEALEAEEVLRS